MLGHRALERCCGQLHRWVLLTVTASLLDVLSMRLLAEITCDASPTIPHTTVRGEQEGVEDRDSHSVNTTLTYTCDAGYRFIDGSESGSVTCDVTGVWIGIDSLADTNRCPVLRVVEHVQVEDGHMNATSGNSEVMVCEEGFIFADGSMSSVIECRGDDGGVLAWHENIPECERV